MGLLSYYRVARAHLRYFNFNERTLSYFLKFVAKFFLSVLLPIKTNAQPKSPSVILTYHSCYLPALFKWSLKQDVRPALIVRYPRKKLLKLLYSLLSKVFKIDIIHRFDAKRIFSANMIIALIDQDSKTKGVWVPFFGIPAKTPSSLVEHALNNNLKVYFMVFSLSGLFVQVNLTEMPTLGTSTEEVCAAFNRNLEQIARNEISSWCWFHKRWRSRPDKKLSHEEYINFFWNNSKL
ncbi:MAG: hypothetical protein QXL01_03760 [Thermoplasmatales archaeon]